VSATAAKDVKIVSLSMVRNEADIVEAWVRYHSPQLDHMVVVCSRSADNTREILRALQAEGLPLEVRDRDALDYPQSEVTTQLMRDVARRMQPDWLLPLDADEFLIPRAAPTARDAVTSLPGDRVALMEMRAYVPTEDDPDDPNVLRRIRHRNELPPEGDFGERGRKALVPLLLARRTRAVVAVGNHWLVDSDTGNLLPSAPVAEPLLAHFPFRSAEQARTKAVGGWIATLAVADQSPGLLGHWRELLEAVVGRERLSTSELQSLAFHGVVDGPPTDVERLVVAPVPAPFELRYEQRTADAQAVALDSAEALAGEIARMRSPSFARRRAADAARRLRRAVRRLAPFRG
jgi:Glycosyl transferase family 2